MPKPSPALRPKPSPAAGPAEARRRLLDLLPPLARDGEREPGDPLAVLGALLREPSGDAWTDEEVGDAAVALRPPSAAAAAFAAELMEDELHERAWAFAAPLLANGSILPADALKLSEAAAATGDPERRIAILSAGLQAYEDAFLLIERAKLRRAAADLPNAVADAAEAARLAPGNAGVHCENVWTLLAAGAAEEGYAAAEAGLASCPDEPGLLRALAVAEQARGNVAAAEAILRRSLENGASDPETRETLRAIGAREVKRDLSALSTSSKGDAPIDPGRVEAFERRVRDLAETGAEGLDEAQTALDRLALFRALPDETRAALFDEAFYAAQLGAEDGAPTDVVAHYVFRGAGRRLSPTPFFEPWTYLEAAGDLDGPDALADCLRRDGPGLPFHPLAAEPSGDRGSGLLALTAGPEVDGEAPEAVQAAAREAARAVRDRFAAATLAALPRLCVERAFAASDLPDGAAAAVAGLFDARFYADRLAERGLDVPPEDAFDHYAREGWRLGLDPHPLFRNGFYVDRTPAFAGSGLDPLSHYVLEGPADALTHPLVEANVHELRAALAKAGRPAGARLLESYLASPPAERVSFVKFFDPAYYRATVTGVDWEVVDPLLHYLAVGFRRGAAPHPAFDPAFVGSRLGSPEAEAAGLSPLELFELHPEPRPAAFALFDPDYYLNLYPDLQKAKLCASTHFLRHGLAEGRRPNPLLLSSYVYAQEHGTAFADRPPLWEYLARKRNRRRRIVFVGHDGTRTGAPGILLRLIKHMAAYEDVECVAILDHGGPLVEDYAAAALTTVKPNGRSQLYAGKVTRETYLAELDSLMKLFDDNPPEIAVCNSAEIRIYAEYFKGRGIPVVSLVHEIASIYPPGELETLATHSDKIVFPADFVASGFRKAYRPRADQSLTLPQGLLRDTYGDRPRGDRVDVYKAAEIDVGDDDVIAVACGTIDGRKGFDLFVRTARLVRERRPEGRVRFVWIGGRRDWRMHGGAAYDSIGHWASWENLQADEDLVHVVAEVRDTEAFLVNADLFLMTSRVDPFPCVVHEAMASRLPVLCFAGTGGAPEAIRDDAGLVLPYLDCDAMADAIVSLAEDPARRAAMGEAGRARVKAEYRFAAYAEKVKGLLEAELGVDPSHFGRNLARGDTRGRVYFGAPSWSPAGAGALTEALVRSLGEAGFEAEILLTRGRFGASADGGLPDAPCRFIQPVTADPQESLARVKNFLADQAPCVFAPGLDPALRALTADLPPNVAVLGLVSADDEDQYDAAYRLGLFWNRIVAASDEIAAQLLRLNPSFAPKVAVIRPGVEAPSAEAVERALAEKEDAAVVRVAILGDGAGSGARAADHCRLVEVLAQRGAPFEATVAAEGAELEAMRGRLKPFVRAGLVRLPGRLDEAGIRALLARSHLLVSLSSSPRATLGAVQAFQHGCAPVVYERSGGVSELVRHGVNGFTTPRGRVEAIAAIVERLAADRDARAALGREAWATVAREGLTAREMGRRYAALIDETLAAVAAGEHPRRSFAGAR